jgi:hypothetical protein
LAQSERGTRDGSGGRRREKALLFARERRVVHERARGGEPEPAAAGNKTFGVRRARLGAKRKSIVVVLVVEDERV